METLKKNFELVRDKVLPRDFDWLHLNIGYERSGKSDFSIQQMFIVDKNPSLNRITFTAGEFRKAVDRAKFYQCIIADEGAESFFSKDAMKPENMENRKLLTKIGAKRLFIIINIPDFFLLDPYVRGHRVRSMCRIVGRGSVAFYSKAKMAQIKRDPENRATIYPEPNFYDNFNKLDGRKDKQGVFWKGYLKKKMDFLRRKSMNDKLREQAEETIEKSFSASETGRILKVSYATVMGWIKDKKIKVIVGFGGRRRIPKSEIERVIRYYGKQRLRIQEALALEE